jgi:hypothetical protein
MGVAVHVLDGVAIQPVARAGNVWLEVTSCESPPIMLL